jgi:hypothetical protein
MLSVAAQDIQPSPMYYAPYHRSMPYRQPEFSAFTASQHQHQHQPHHHSPHQHHHIMAATSHQQHQDAAVSQALEIARESPDGAQDPTVSKILEQALSSIWAKVEAQPTSYVMTRDEFAVFNFFQHRFIGNQTAVLARRRYWDETHA